MKSFLNILSCFLMVLLMLLTVPVAKAQVSDSLALPDDSAVLPMATGYDWITYRGKMDLIDQGGTRSCNFYMVNRTDSILYLNLHAFGVEVLRAVLTPDSVTLVDKLHYQYYKGTYEPISKKLPFSVDFKTAQALFNGDTEKLPQGQGLSFEYLSFEPVDSTSSFFTEFVFKEFDHLLEVQGQIKVIRLNVPGVTAIKIPEKFTPMTF